MTSISKGKLADIQIFSDSGIELIIYTITESEEELFSWAYLPIEKEQLNKISAPKKRLEYLTSLKLVKSKFGVSKTISKNKFGAPFIEGESKQVSLSHSFPKVCLAISDFQCGVDVEEIREKVLRIGPKFLNDFEKEQTKLNSKLITLGWSAKETVFKLYQKGEVDFKNHIHLNFGKEQILAHFRKGKEFKVGLKYRVIENFVLVYGHLK